MLIISWFLSCRWILLVDLWIEVLRTFIFYVCCRFVRRCSRHHTLHILLLLYIWFLSFHTTNNVTKKPSFIMAFILQMRNLCRKLILTFQFLFFWSFSLFQILIQKINALILRFPNFFQMKTIISFGLYNRNNIRLERWLYCWHSTYTSIWFLLFRTASIWASFRFNFFLLVA